MWNRVKSSFFDQADFMKSFCYLGDRLNSVVKVRQR